MKKILFILLLLVLSCSKTSITTSPPTPTTPTPAPGSSYNYFLYIGTTAGTQLYKVDPATGLPGSPTLLTLCGGLIPDPTKKMAYIPCGSDNTIKTYAINASTGNLTQTQSVTTSAAGGNVSLDPNGHFMVSMDWGSGDIYSYSVNSSTGVITAQGSAFSTGAYCNYPVNLVVDSSGKYAYQSCYYSAAVAIYSLNPTTGQPTYVGSQSIASGGAAFVGASPTEPYIFIADQDNNAIDSYAIASGTGLLTLKTNLSVPTGPDWGSVDDTGRFFYTSNQGGSPGVSQISVHTDGTLTIVSPGVLNSWDGSTGSDGNMPTSFNGLPFAYVGNGTTLSVLNFNNSTGVMSFLQAVNSGAGTGGSQSLRVLAP